MKKSSKKHSRWVVTGGQSDKTYGKYATKREAHNAVCLAYEPESPINETRKYMPLHYYEANADRGPIYLIWDETVLGWHNDSPLFCISEEYDDDKVEKDDR